MPLNGTASLRSSDLKVGDILLQPLHCWACNLIEAQTQSEFSHIGVVSHISQKEKKVFVAEAFMKVREIEFNEFNKKTQKGLSLKVYRPGYVAIDFRKTFKSTFENLAYDSGFLWDDEKIYCSELLYKLFRDSNMKVPEALPMKFDVNREHWEKYFKGHVPEGEIGISPADFDDESLYEFIGYI